MFKKILVLVGVIGMVFICRLASATEIHVPGDYLTIQAGINAAIDGDTVLVADGTYTGMGNKNIDFLGKAILVISENGQESCIIDCENDGRGFLFESEEDSTSVLCGFKITNGRAEEGGGIAIWYSSPLIRDCIIQDNVAWYEDGGGIFCTSASPLIVNCEILDNTVLGWLRGYGHGGGISCRWDSHPNITDCIISGNSVYSSWVTNGGGIYSIYGSSVNISHSIISGNSANNGIGGGFWCTNGCNFSISNCMIYGNSASEGGGIALGGDCNLHLVNSIVTGNETNGIEFSISFNIASLAYCDFYDNVGGDFAGSNIPPELGQIVTINANDDSCDIFYNIFEDPLLEDPASGNFQLTWANFPIPDSTMSPCIDAGDPASPLDPDGTVADIGAFYFDQTGSPIMWVDPILHRFGEVVVGQTGEVPFTVYAAPDGLPVVLYGFDSSNPTVYSTNWNPEDSLIAPGDSLELIAFFTPTEIAQYAETIQIAANADPITMSMSGSGICPAQVNLTPYNPPIVIPESGGSFGFNISVRNLVAEPQTFDLWTEIVLPGVGSVQIMTVTGLTLQGGASLDRDRTQQVPGSAPAGTYNYYAYIGEYPWLVKDYDVFTFNKEGAEQIGSLGSPSDWLNTGESFDLWRTDSGMEIPTTFSFSLHPNPFNPVTTLSFALPEATRVNLAVFDVSSRLVTALVNGWREAGSHEVTFDGSGLASGIYFVKLTAGDYVGVQKMVLMK